jgi:CRISPR-associated endoribonuclease Cas6
MPTMIEMRLKATWAVRLDTRQLHGLACALFEGDADEHERQQKPWAVWPLRQAGAPEEWEWRTAWLPDTVPPSRVITTDALRVGHVSCSVAESSQRRVSHAALAGASPSAAATITFGSPTYFSQNGADIVTPDPRLIVGSWRRQWNASLPAADPLAISDEEWTATHRSLRLTRFELRTEPRDNGHGRDRAGFTGTATIQLASNAPSASKRIFGTLARFAAYSGTGAQTTHGFGATTVSVLDRDPA